MIFRRPLIELKNVRKHFADFSLEEVDLNLYAGEVHVLVGENGSGKSTLMKLDFRMVFSRWRYNHL